MFNIFAQEAANGTGIISSYLPILLFAVGGYFLLIRPMLKKQREQKEIQSSLGVGDKIVTIGGFIGLIVEVTSDGYVIELSDGNRAGIIKAAVARKYIPEDELVAEDWDEDEDEETDPVMVTKTDESVVTAHTDVSESTHSLTDDVALGSPETIDRVEPSDNSNHIRDLDKDL